jgi:polysaccharide pyruvyl transferase WcaK-like protein
MRRADTLLTRDRNCNETVQQMSGRLPQFCPDVAFTLPALEPAQPRIEPGPLDLRRLPASLVGINVSGLLYMGGYDGRNMFGLRSNYREVIHAVAEDILSSTASSILIVPHVFGTEQEEAASVLLQEELERRYPTRVFRLANALTAQELKWIIGKTEFFVGSRMHACIAALSQGVPAVGLAYSDKFLGVFESAGVGDAIVDLRTADTDEVRRRTISAIRQRAELTSRLASRSADIRRAVEDVFSGLLSGPAERHQRASEQIGAAR